jgi:two-component system, chemotaxis family, CheB/CheR fusion protein
MTNDEQELANRDLVDLLGTVEVPIVLVGVDRRIRRFTPRARSVLNVGPADAGRPIGELRPALAIADLEHKVAEVIETATMHEEELRGRDGRWYRLQIRPHTAAGGVDGAVLSVVDIDVLKRALGAAEWAREYAKATLDAIPTPLLVLDGRLTVLSANEAFHDRYGRLALEPERPHVYAIMDRAWDFAALRSALERVLAGERVQRLEVERALPGEGVRALWLSARSVPAPVGDRMVVLAVEDITERRRVERERARLLDEARDARASADEANRAKDQFLATLSHELRTPLSTLLMQSQLLRIGPVDEAKLRRAAESIEKAALAQTQLIDDLLDISRIVTGKLKMEIRVFALASVVRAAAETVAAAAEAKEIAVELELDEVPAVSGDPTRLQQVVWNLLTNAIKFTPKGGRVTVVVDATDDRGRIRVIDTGCGIEPQFLHHVFDRFTQEDRTQTRGHGGLGLGLAIARHLTEAHGGTIQVDSAGKGQGATFTVRLPLLTELDRQAATAGGVPGLPPRSLEHVRVLIVEDDPGTRDALTEMLRLCGADVHPAASASEAMQIFERLRPELLVCDIAMPEEDGYGLIRKIRALGPGRGGAVPALALTALATADDRRRALAAGFHAHMAKPVDIGRLRDALADLRGAAKVEDLHRAPP